VKRFFECLDSGAYDAIVATIRNVSDRQRTMLINTTPFYLPPQSVTPLRAPIRLLTDAFQGDPIGVTHFAITSIPPDDETWAIEVDDVGFVKQADNRAWHAWNAAQTARDRARETGGGRFVLGVESPMRQVFVEPHRYGPRLANAYSLQAARNESESFQLVVVPCGEDLEDVTWAVSPPVNADGSELPAWTRVVGYVETQPVTYTLNNPHGDWYPDLLVDADRIGRLRGSRFLNLWVKVYVPSDAAPGEYRGEVTVSCRNDDAWRGRLCGCLRLPAQTSSHRREPGAAFWDGCLRNGGHSQSRAPMPSPLRLPYCPSGSTRHAPTPCASSNPGAGAF